MQKKRTGYKTQAIVKRKGKEAYNKRKRTRISWKEIAKELKYSEASSARRCAMRYALKNGLQWPIQWRFDLPDGRTLITKGTMADGQFAYIARAEGSTWQEIIQMLSGGEYDYRYRARRVARGYARTHNLPWPPTHEQENVCRKLEVL